MKGVDNMFSGNMKHKRRNRKIISNFSHFFISCSSNIRAGRFLRNLFISYFIIIVISISAMGILSYNLEKRRIVDLTIESNNELLNHYKNTIDDLILGNLDKLSLYVLQSVINDPEISYYFSNSYEDKYTELTNVMDYLNRQKSTNPILSSISIYYSANDLLVTTEGITFTGSNAVAKDYIRELINSNSSSFWRINKEKDRRYPDNGETGYIYLLRKVAFISSLSGSTGGIAITVNEDVLHNIIKGSAPVDFGEIFIIDENGMIISHTQKDHLFLNVSEISYGNELLKQSDKSGYFIADSNGIRSMVSFVSSGINNWRYVTVKPIAKFSEGLQVLGKLIQIIGLVTFIFSLLASIVSTKHFYTLLKRLGDLCRNIVNVHPANKPKDEYDLIGSTLGAVSVKLKENEEQLEKNMPIIKHHFIYNLIYTRYENKDEIVEKMKFLNIQFPYDSFMVITMKLVKIPQHIDYEIYELIKIQIMNEVEGAFSVNKNCICTEVNNRIAAIINFNIKVNDMKECITRFSHYLREEMQIDLYFAVSSTCDSITDVHKLFIESESCMNYSYLYPERYIFAIDEIHKWEIKTPEYGKNLLNNLCNSLKEQDKKLTLNYIHSLFNDICNEHYSYNYSMKLLTKFSTFIESMTDILRIDKSEIAEGDFITQFNKASNIDELEKWFISMINRIFEIVDSRKSEKVSGLVAEVKEYISENIMNCDLSLNSAADAKCISSTYLSRIFKDETGMNFVDYLMDAKLAAAERMVIESNLKIEDISSLIGYSSPQYFIRKFKVQYGCTPKEYRMMFLRKEKSSNEKSISYLS